MKKESERDLMMNQEMSTIKREDKIRIIKRMQNVKEYEIEKYFSEL
jgi:hypothetical protein